MTENNAVQIVLTDKEIMDIMRYGQTDARLLQNGRAIESALLSKLRAPVADMGNPMSGSEKFTHGDDYARYLASAPVAGEAQWPFPKPGSVCKGSVALGSGCGICERCKEEKARLRANDPKNAAPQASEAVRMDDLKTIAKEVAADSAAIRAEARNAALEEAARLIETTRETTTIDHGGDTQRHLTPRKTPDLIGMTWAEGIRALKTQADKDGGDCAKGAENSKRIMRFNIHGTVINPHPNGMYVRYEDHCAALPAQPGAQRTGGSDA